ncbi:MAG: hypothetical protein C7B45_01090 [Sulfobacillus acidophilus]|uniref:Uncharacterized protein n=1 Tax=Sulfobacillus acidophilus TaxID=53633 RepID=A0A2T2WNU7_9FIRM|nr:MAG: hypothetical protein C7B45_01090 [Sulfobacillus acidophilus]
MRYGPTSRSNTALGLATKAAHVDYYVVYLMMWAVAGTAALHGSFPSDTRTMYLALLGGLILAQAAAARLAGVGSVRIGLRLKRWLLEQVTHLSPETVRRAGRGTYLGILFESETLQALTFSGGSGGLLGALELVVASRIVSITDFPYVLFAEVGWYVLQAGLVLGYRARFWAWTQERLTLTTDLTERLIGHDTRLVQGVSLAGEDADYRRISPARSDVGCPFVADTSTLVSSEGNDGFSYGPIVFGLTPGNCSRRGTAGLASIFPIVRVNSSCRPGLDVVASIALRMVSVFLGGSRQSERSHQHLDHCP